MVSSNASREHHKYNDHNHHYTFSSCIAVPQREPQNLQVNRFNNGQSILVSWLPLTLFEVQSCEFIYRIRYSVVINRKRQATSGVIDASGDDQSIIINDLQPELAYDIRVTAAIAVEGADPVEGPAAQMRVATDQELEDGEGIVHVCTKDCHHLKMVAASLLSTSTPVILATVFNIQCAHLLSR